MQDFLDLVSACVIAAAAASFAQFGVHLERVEVRTPPAQVRVLPVRASVRPTRPILVAEHSATASSRPC